jgi:hypothetical protein
MKEFIVLNNYPTNVDKHKLEKNFGLIILVIISAVIFWYIFNVTSIAAGSNIIRGLLFLTLATVALWKINEKTKEIPLVIDEDTVTIGLTKIKYNEIYGFDIVDLTDYLEIVIVTTRLTNQFEYIYLPSSSPDAAIITKELLDNIQYIEHLNDKDFVHKMLRRVYVK